MAAERSAPASALKAESPPTPERLRFALGGPSRPLDTRRNAARRDLADVRLAGRWFAPHYADPEAWITADETALRQAPSETSEQLLSLATGEVFQVLEVSGGWAWGFRQADDLVGYVRSECLRRST